jgi:hypothetical protein
MPGIRLRPWTYPLPSRSTRFGLTPSCGSHSVFTWVRLAQRVPVRIQIDQVPDGVRLFGKVCVAHAVYIRIGLDADDASGRKVWQILLRVLIKLVVD